MIQGTFYLTLASFLFMFVGYMTNVLLGRHFGPSTYGLYGIIISLMTSINILQVAGVPQAVSKFIAENKKEANNILAAGLKVQFILTTLTSIVFVALVPLITYSLSSPELKKYLWLLALIFPFYGLFNVYGGYYNGLHKFKRQAVMLCAYSLSKFIFVILLGFAYGLMGVIAGLIISPILGLLAGIKFFRSTKGYSYRKLSLYALPLVGFSVIATFQLSVDLFLLKAILDDSRSVGYYAASQSIALIPYFGMSAIGQVLFPSVSKFIGSGQINEARQVIGTSVRYLLLVLLPIATILFATAPSLINLLFGAEFLPAVTPTRILLISYVFLTIFAILTNVLNGAGRVRSSIYIAAFGLLIAIFSCLILIPKHGANGAAIGTLLGACSVAILSAVLTHKVFKFKVFYSSAFRAIAGSLVILIMGLLVPTSIILLPIIYLVLGAIYLLLLRFMGELSGDDKEHIKNLLPTWLPLGRFF
jgi:O-antigen/teichoic acid export membrane protein